MTEQSRIDKGLYWDHAWSLVQGCTPVSAGCVNCWAAAQAHMRKAQKNPKIRKLYRGLTTKDGLWSGRVRLLKENLEIPIRTMRPTVFAVWNDPFHEKVDADFMLNVFSTMMNCPQHRFLLLSKRSARLREFVNHWWRERLPEHIWLGVTAEDQRNADRRLPDLIATPAAHKFISVEPMLGPIDFSQFQPFCRNSDSAWDQTRGILSGQIDWVVIGCETGPRRRPCKIRWVEDVVEQCRNADVPVFVKALDIRGKVSKKIEDWPEHLRLRQIPEGVAKDDPGSNG